MDEHLKEGTEYEREKKKREREKPDFTLITQLLGMYKSPDK